VTKSPELLLSEAAQLLMVAAAARAHPCETGGILIGVYVGECPWVTSALEIETNERGRNHYKIPAGTTQAAVLTARLRDPRLGYLGDWHSHPSDVGPSPTDLATLAFISARHPRGPNPTQVVVRKSGRGYALDARRFSNLTPRSCTIKLTGGLPGTGPTTDPMETGG
jgi:proteasome lid subunit RPN8/RPN11